MFLSFFGNPRYMFRESRVYAAAKSERAWLWTQDGHFEKLPGVKYIAI
jgi:hypothetical protein